MSRRRRCIVLRGSAEETRAAALAVLRELDDEAVLWIGGDTAPRFVCVSPREVRRLLGRAFDAVVLDLHDGLDADVLGQCEGFVWGGGALLLRMPAPSAPPPRGPPALAVHPFSPADVSQRFWGRFERVLSGSDAVEPARVVLPPEREVQGTEDQRRAVAELARTFRERSPALIALLSDRGRGKSSALGLSLRAALAGGTTRVAISAPSVESAAEIFRFATGAPSPLRFVPPFELAYGDEDFDVIVIDEAAQLPVPLLERIARRFPEARIAFATTARGYEGTGRGFVLRFLEWARRQPRPFVELQLSQPIRFGAGDPLERLVHDALALDAEPASGPGLAPLDDEIDIDDVEHRVLDRGALAHDDELLRDFFGLLVHAHYRTTPSDLHRALDAPNLALHALLHRGRVVAASLVAREGGLPRDLCEALARGRQRIRGHALPETLVWHCARPEAGELRFLRSVRIAVHPALRRRGLASRLVEHVHRSYDDVDLFGTLFGVTPELLRFRRSLGYELVRVGVALGSRTGEPSVAMVRPVSPRAAALVDELRVDLARSLPRQLSLLAAEGDGLLDGEVERALLQGLPEVKPLSADEVRAVVAHYVESPQPFEVVAHAVTRWVEEHAALLDVLEPRPRRLVEERVRRGGAWTRSAKDAGYGSVPAAMRELRRAIRSLFEAAEAKRSPDDA